MSRGAPRETEHGVRLEKRRERLLDLQFELKAQARAALVLIASGIPAAGRTETVARIAAWLDPKLLDRYATGVAGQSIAPTTPGWRWWPAVPAKGRLSIVYGGWYDDALLLLKVADDPTSLLRHLAKASREFERYLRDERVEIVKLHFHIDRELQRERLKSLAANPATAWRVQHADRAFAHHYGKRIREIASLLNATSFPGAHWQTIDGAHEHARERQALSALLAGFGRAIKLGATPPRRGRVEPRPKQAVVLPSKPSPDRAAATTADALAQAQGRFARLVLKKRFRRRSLVVLFEGMDGAGKSTVLRRITGALDPRQYRVVAIGPPTAEELSYPYLWRFWRQLPAAGEVVLFDRSWYGRVLVERVEGITARADWHRAYREIRTFETELVERGVILVKIWLSVSREEQLARFRGREASRLKRFKIEPSDWRARRRWDAYQAAAVEAFRRTSRPQAPWIVVEADDKPFARLKVVETVRSELARALRR